MRRLVVVLFVISIVFCFIGRASAALYEFRDTVIINKSINQKGTIPVSNAWGLLDFPNGGVPGNYTGGVFEYDDYYSYPKSIEYFDITLYGHGDNTKDTIDLFLDLDKDHKSYISVAIPGKDVDDKKYFTLRMDIKENELLYNVKTKKTYSEYSYVKDLTNVNLATFANIDSFYVGAGCKFHLDSYEVRVGVNPIPAASNHTPEPSTMLLLLTGIIGLIGIKKKFKR